MSLINGILATAKKTLEKLEISNFLNGNLLMGVLLANADELLPLLSDEVHGMVHVLHERNDVLASVPGVLLQNWAPFVVLVGHTHSQKEGSSGETALRDESVVVDQKSVLEDVASQSQSLHVDAADTSETTEVAVAQRAPEVESDGREEFTLHGEKLLTSESISGEVDEVIDEWWGAFVVLGGDEDGDAGKLLDDLLVDVLGSRQVHVGDLDGVVQSLMIKLERLLYFDQPVDENSTCLHV